MLSEEVLNASLDDGNAGVEAQGLRTLGGIHVSVGGRLDKTRRSAHAGSETRLWANHGGRGVCVPRLNLAEAGKASWRKGQGFKPDLGKPAVRDYRGASGNVAMVKMRSLLATERAGKVTLHLKLTRPSSIPTALPTSN